MKRLIAFILLFASHAFAQIPCVDTLAAAKYPEALKAIPLTYGVGVFAKTFGDALPVVKNELARGRIKIRVNLLWSDTHSFGDKDIPFIKKEAARYQPLCAMYPGRVELATFTEHNLNNPDKYHDIVQKAAPSCSIVNTPWKGVFSKKYKNEIHGDHKIPQGAFNYSYDGTNSVDSDVVSDRQKYSQSEMLCMWGPELNGRCSMQDSTPRPQRKCWASKEYLESLVYLFTQKGPFSIPKNWLIKSHSEYHGPGDSKGDKLLIISPVNAPYISLTRNGKLVAKLPKFGSYLDGRIRYYANTWGYKLGADLDVQIGKKLYGVINGGFRSAPFR